MCECVYNCVRWGWEDKYLLKWQESVFHIGTIIPEHKTRCVPKVNPFTNLYFCVLQCCLRSEKKRSVHHTLNTKDLKLWKSPRERASRTQNTWFYLLFFLLLNLLRASGLEQTFKATWSHTDAILNLVRLYCFVFLGFFFHFWEGWCSSQYYHLVDDCTSL